MEGPKFENNLEQEKNIIKLDHEKLRATGWGLPVIKQFPEALKLFAIIRNLKDNSVPKEKMLETADDLFNEFDVDLYDFDNVFTNNVLNQIAAAKTIDAIEIEVNYKPYVITSQSTVESLTAEFEGNLKPTEAQEVKWKADKEKDTQEIAEKQKNIDDMLANIDELDFSNLENVVEWLYEYNKHANRVGVDHHEDELLQKFATHGYIPEKNDKVEFMLGETLQDKRRFGEAMIGFMLQNMGIFERGNEMRNAIDDWKKGIMKS